jgi:hypothetical protein
MTTTSRELGVLVGQDDLAVARLQEVIEDLWHQ